MPLFELHKIASLVIDLLNRFHAYKAPYGYSLSLTLPPNHAQNSIHSSEEASVKEDTTYGEQYRQCFKEANPCEVHIETIEEINEHFQTSNTYNDDRPAD